MPADTTLVAAPPADVPLGAARRDALLAEARRVLAANWMGRATKPSPTLYPHQWNWDSGFIAVGNAHHAPERAELELATLFDAQWANGMVPHIVFNPAALDEYFPGPDFWRAHVSPDAPPGVPTSGITQPAVHAIAALRLLEVARDGERARRFLRTLVPNIERLHAYLYATRDAYGDGLVYIRHPWESGTDNAPTWDAPLARIDLTRAEVPPYTRKDLRRVPASERPTREDYDRYVYLVDLFRRLHYDERAIRAECPFLVVDPMFNAILAHANEALAELAPALGLDGGRAREWAVQTRAALDARLWNDGAGIYDAWDVRGDTQRGDTRVPTRAISGVMPLLAGAPNTERAERLVRLLESDHFSGTPADPAYRFASYDLTAPEFRPDLYWRGPVWVNTAWLLHRALRRTGYDALAGRVRADVLALVDRYGFSEYFHPRRRVPDGEKGAFGGAQFSWTAALFVDFAVDLAAGGA